MKTISSKNQWGLDSALKNAPLLSLLVGGGTGEQADINSIVAVQMCCVVKGGIRLTGPWGWSGEPAIHMSTITTFLNMNLVRPVQSWLLLRTQCDMHGLCQLSNIQKEGKGRGYLRVGQCSWLS